MWRDGSSAKSLADLNPYNGRTIATFKLANLQDLDEAYRSGEAAQKIWADVNPFEKRAILEKAIAWRSRCKGVTDTLGVGTQRSYDRESPQTNA